MLIAFLAAAVAPTSAASPAKPIAEGSWFSGNDYPAEAAKKGIEGSVTFEVDVDATGKPTACRIAKSSGSDLLDQTTCRIVLAKGKFLPAMLNGKPVSDTIRKTTIWRLTGPSGLPNGYVAQILDFSNDPNHPSCSILRNGILGGATCDEAVQSFGQLGAREKLRRLVVLTSVTTPSQQPFQGEADWGRRAGFVAVELYPTADGTKPTCAVIEEQGVPPTTDPCSRYGEVRTVSDADKRNPHRVHIEQSFFVVPQQTTPSTGKCKDGESSAEVQGCV